MKKIVLALVIVLFQIAILIPPSIVKAAGKKQMFMVSAYYSPLPNQSFYIRGSFEADKRLNGNGTNGADGTQVYVGMLAAPRSYAFGTKIKVPGLGVGEVHDRGGAILAKKNYDRIDVWMGKGEAGLARALNWGMRLVEGEIYPAKSGVSPVLNYQWVNSKLPSSVEKRLKAKTVAMSKPKSSIAKKVEPKKIEPKVVKTDINTTKLQEIFRINGYFYSKDGARTDNSKKPTIAFELPKLNKEQQRIQDNMNLLVAGLGKNSSGDSVYVLQQILWEMGYYKNQLTGKYNDSTIDAVFSFQKEFNVVKGEFDLGAGYFGVKTHSALVAAMGVRSEKISKYPKEMQSWVPAKTKLPKLNSFNKKIEIRKREPLRFGI